MKKPQPTIYIRLTDTPDWDDVEWADYALEVFDEGECVAEYRLVRVGRVELNAVLKTNKETK